MHLSIVSPVYKAEGILMELVYQIEAAVQPLNKSFEIILVEDCGGDQSWEKIEQICASNPRVKGIKLSRNFGQHYAITAGLEASKGDWVVVMDCDLQDRPDEIPNLYRKALEGNDLVIAQRKVRQDSFFKKLSSKFFYKVFSYLTDTRQDSSVGNFGIYSKQVIQAVLDMKDHIRFFPTMSRWVGFQRAYLPVKHSSRAEGKSSYTLRALIRLAFDNMIAFSDKPLRIMVKFGAYLSIVAFGLGIFYLIKYFLGQISEPGFTTLIVSIWFLSGVIIFMLGIVGIYVGKNFEKSKDRPIYIIDKTVNLKSEDGTK